MKKIKIPIYDFIVNFYTCKKEAKSEDRFATIDYHSGVIDIVVNDELGGVLTPKFMQVLTHECNHAAMCILNDVDIIFNFEHQEALCYMQDFIFKACYEHCLKLDKFKGDK